MSQDFVKVLVKDDRLNVTDTISYAVHKGGQNMTSANFNAISQTPSNITFNIQVPSEQTIIDRRVLLQSTIVLALTCANTPAGQLPINYGITDALAAFPLHQLMTVMTATINNNSVSINIRDVLPALLRLHDRRELERYNGMTPVMPDLLASYPDGVGSLLNSLGAWSNAADNDLLPRGSWVLDGISTTLPVANSTATLPTAGYTGIVYVQFTVTEPLFLSPFIWADPKSNNQGFYGIQNMNFVFNLGDTSRVWRSANVINPANAPSYANQFISASSVQSISNTKLIFNFLTPHPSDLFPARNSVAYWESPRYITSNLSPIGGFIPSSIIAKPSVTTLQTSSLQLNQIPDKIMIMVRQPLGNCVNSTPDTFLGIQGVSVNFNNQSGILASATPNDLWRYSVENGSNQSWLEFSGFANIPDVVTGCGKRIPTSGSLVILEFGKDIQLTEDYYASGSLGNFNLQLNLQVFNQYPYFITPEIVIICINSGLFVNERGTSSTYTGILTKADVLEASAQQPVFQSTVKRMVGGGFLDSLKTIAGKVLPHLVKAGVDEMGDHPVAQAAKGIMGAMGYGQSGAGAGNGHTGGRRMKLAERLMK